MRIVFVGGGTGGHFYPLMAIAEAVRDKNQQSGIESDLFYIGPEPYKQEVLERLSIRFVKCPAGKKRNYFSLANYFDVFVTGFGVLLATWKLLWLYPDVVMSKGGYTSVPVVLAAAFLRIPIVIHESDAVPGRANVLAAHFAKIIGVAYKEVSEYFPKGKVVEVGMPISRAMKSIVNDPHAALGITKDRPVILVTGGSTGAERLNNFVLGALPTLLTKFTVIHQVGAANVEQVTSTATSLFTDQSSLGHYYVFGHLSQQQFAAAIEAADLVVTRGGSTTLFEVAQKFKPTIVVPIPEDISRDQRSNAYAYARITGAIVLEEHNLSDDILAAEIKRVLEDSNTYAEMVSGAKALTVGDAGDTLADILTDIGREHE